jgi:hypothetical protein
MGRKLGIDSKAVAYAVLEDLMNEEAVEPCWESRDSNGIAHHLLEAAEVEFQPRARKLILTFDLAEPEEAPAMTYVGADDEPVPFVPAEPAAPAD